jgi:uncharacterized protein Usg
VEQPVIRSARAARIVALQRRPTSCRAHKHFLNFWSHNLEGKLYRVTVAHKRLITPAELRLVADELPVH